MTKLSDNQNPNNQPESKNKSLLLAKLKSCSCSKTFIAVTFLLFGVAATMITQSLADNSKSSADQQIEMLTEWQKEVNQWMNDFHRLQIDRSDRFFDDFYSGPFADFDRVHQRMRQRFENFDKYFDDNFTKYQSRSSRTSISQKEDDNFYYYFLTFKGFDKDDITTNIKDNILTFAAKKQSDKLLEENGTKSQFKSNSNFLYSFTIPNGADVKNPEVTKEDSKITVKLKKSLIKD